MVDSHVGNFTCSLTNGIKFELFNTLKNGPVIIIFIENSWNRAFDKHVQKINNYLQKKKMENKSTLLIVAPLPPNEVNTIKNKNNLKLLMVADTEKEIIDLFGIKFPFANETIPYTVIIGQNQKITSELGFDKQVA